MSIREFLLAYGLEEESIENFLKKNPIRNVEQLSLRVDYFKSVFGYSDEDIKYLMEINPFIFKLVSISESTKSVKGKIDFYKDMLGFSTSELGEIILKCPKILLLDLEINEPYTALGHIEYFKNDLKLSNEEIREIIKDDPEVLTKDLDTFKTSDEDEGEKEA